MKKPLYLLCLFVVSVLLSACPYSSPYALDEQPSVPIDESYIGKWATMVTKIIDDKHSVTEPAKIIFTKKNDMEYNVDMIGYINDFRRYSIVTDDTIKGTAFLSVAADRHFLNIIVAGKTYLAEIKNENGIFSIYPLNDHFTNKMIKSAASLRNCLEFHYKTRVTPFYEEDFILKDLKRVN